MAIEPAAADPDVVGFLERAEQSRHAPGRPWTGDLRFGIDLGTATIVLSAVDGRGEPVWWSARSVPAVRDGVVVDFQAAVAATRSLVGEAESALDTTVVDAATAAPPAVPVADRRACHYVVEGAGIDCRAVVDEVSAAQGVLAVRDGAVVDVGGGSTGVGIYRGGELVSLTDRPGGGHHLDLILAGALGIPVEEAEALKRSDGAAHLGMLTPGVERIAESIRAQCDGVCPGPIHLAGGALLLPRAADIVAARLGWPTVAYPNAHLITPFGIARTPADRTSD